MQDDDAGRGLFIVAALADAWVSPTRRARLGGELMTPHRQLALTLPTSLSEVSSR
jgi:hypothetical protein